MIISNIKPKDRVRTKIAVGTKLPAGSVGVVVSVDAALYPKDTNGDAFIVSVVFPTLGPPEQQQAAVEGLDPMSVPHFNAVPFRVRELELIDSLVTEGGN